MWIVYSFTYLWMTVRSVFLHCLCVMQEQPQCCSISIMSWWLSECSVCVCGIRVGLQGQEIISQKRWARLWRLLSLYFNGSRALNLQGQTSWGVKQNTHTHQVPRTKMSVSVPLLPSMLSSHAQGHLYMFFSNRRKGTNYVTILTSSTRF